MKSRPIDPHSAGFQLAVEFMAGLLGDWWPREIERFAHHNGIAPVILQDAKTVVARYRGRAVNRGRSWRRDAS